MPGARSDLPPGLFENLTAVLRLGERMLNACETVEEFNAGLEKRHRPNLDGSSNTRLEPEHFSRLKASLACGEGLGKDFVRRFIGDRKGTGNSVVQTVIDSYYAESRKAA